jgi:hypothetical protein
VIDLRSKDFDAVLRLEESKTGKAVDINDDGGSGTDARLTFEPAMTGEFRIVVTSGDRKSGNYTLSVREK